MGSEPNAVIADILWHSLVPCGTGNRQRVLKLSEHAVGLDLHLFGPPPIPDKFPFVRYSAICPSRPPPLSLGFNREILGYLTPQAVHRVAASVDDLNPDVVQAEGLWAVPAAYYAARASKAPLVVTVNNLEHRVLAQRRRRLSSHVVRMLERWYYRKADLLIAVSDVDKKRIRMLLGTACPPVTVIPNGIDPPQAVPRPAELPHPNVLFLGKTDYPPNKEAIGTLMTKWVPAARDRGIEIHPVVVGGPDPPREDRKALFLGYVDDIWPYLAAADVCVAPLSAGSGTRIKVLSYLAAGRPTIATGIAAEGLGLENGVHYIQADSSSDFADALQRVIVDAELRRTLSVQGKALAHRFHWKAMSERWSRTVLAITPSPRRRQIPDAVP